MPTPEASGWAVHGIVIGVLVAIGTVVTLVDRRGPSSGGWISLRGLVSTLVWIVLGSYAASSTLTFALLRHRWGVLPSYLAAVPIPVALWMLRRALEHGSASRRYRRQAADLVSRLDLLSWFPRTPEPGRLRLHAEIRAHRDLQVRFDGIGCDAAGSAVALAEGTPGSVDVKAGETARLEVVLPFPPDRPPVEHVLEFTTWIAGAPTGRVSYERVEADVDGGEWNLRRPLPPPAVPEA